jgi:hypothetical protein
MMFIIGTGKYLQKHRQHNDTKAILIHLGSFTAKETPKMAFAPKFDLFEYHLNQSSSDQFDFAQKQKLQVSSAIIVFTFFTAFKTPFPRYAFPPSRSSTASCSPVDAPEGTAALPKTCL